SLNIQPQFRIRNQEAESVGLAGLAELDVSRRQFMKAAHANTAQVNVQPTNSQFRLNRFLDESGNADLIQIQEEGHDGQRAKQDEDAAPAKDAPAPAPKALWLAGHFRG